MQFTINLVAMSLKVAPTLGQDDDFRLPIDTIATTFHSGLQWTKEEAAESHRTWTLSNGLRDTVESVSSFVESAHKVLSVWALGERQNGGARLRLADWEQEIDGGGKAFHRLGLPDKLDHIAKEHDFAHDDTLARQLLSINAARNCLVHRRGIVSDRDLNDGSKLTVEWRKLSYILKDEDGERPLVLGQTMAVKDSWVCIRVVDDKKSFSLGERVQFTTQESADMTWGLFAFGTDLVQKVSAMGIAKGFVTTLTQAQPDIVNPCDSPN